MFKYTSRKPFQANFRPGEPGARNSAPAMQELGALLRERREAMGATLAEVEAATRIRQKYLAALESDEWQLLPGEVIGRGFLRNYATYLGLDSTEVIERRRAVADPSLAGALSNISAGAPLPAQRAVDYRPKDVAIRDEPEAIERREIRLAPIMTVLGLFGVLFIVWWGINTFGAQVSNGVDNMMGGVQTRVADARATFTPTPPQLADAGQGVGTPVSVASLVTSTTGISSTVNNPAPAGLGGAPTITPTQSVAVAELILVPTNTPLPSPTPAVANTPEPTATATNTPEPTPTATPIVEETPTEIPTETPVPAPVVAAAAQCADPRAVLSSPGVGQTVSGVINITGSATHEAFQNYKLEYAADGGGFNWFTGGTSQVQDGVLGTLDTTALANGAYTLQLTVVDLSANFPPPCQVTVFIQN